MKLKWTFIVKRVFRIIGCGQVFPATEMLVGKNLLKARIVL